MAEMNINVCNLKAAKTLAIAAQEGFRTVGNEAVIILIKNNPKWMTASEIVREIGTKDAPKTIGKALRDEFENLIDTERIPSTSEIPAYYRYRFKQNWRC